MYTSANTIMNLSIIVYISIGLLLLLLNYKLVARSLGSIEKNSPYECGFDPFSTVRERTSIHFYLVSILFLIFDIEIIFLFPWGLALGRVVEFPFIMFTTMMLFLWLLTVGFV
jgi:NADH-quinone oxidoreductase subunit A